MGGWLCEWWASGTWNGSGLLAADAELTQIRGPWLWDGTIGVPGARRKLAGCGSCSLSTPGRGGSVGQPLGAVARSGCCSRSALRQGGGESVRGGVSCVGNTCGKACHQVGQTEGRLLSAELSRVLYPVTPCLPAQSHHLLLLLPRAAPRCAWAVLCGAGATSPPLSPPLCPSPLPLSLLLLPLSGVGRARWCWCAARGCTGCRESCDAAAHTH